MYKRTTTKTLIHLFRDLKEEEEEEITMAAFTGTLDKCKACDKTVYVMDLMTLEGMPYHKSCFRCSHCNGTLVVSIYLLLFSSIVPLFLSKIQRENLSSPLQICNYSSMDGVLYCKTHFEQLFKESGNFSKNFQTGC